MSVHTEAAFEESIESHLLKHGWQSVDPASYDRKQGIFAAEYVTFLQASQPKEWARLEAIHGGATAATQKIIKRLTAQIDSRGAIDVLRGVIKDSGVTLRSAYFKPANTLTPELAVRYDANRLGVVRQLHHSESSPADSLDLVLTVNGIPVATAELKNSLTHQTVEHAMAQYRSDRNPSDRIFAHRAFVHFAVDAHRVHMTTRLAKDRTVFLPFNQGDAGPGKAGGDGNPAAPVSSDDGGGYRTAYLWEQLWQRDAWLDVISSFVHVSGGRVLFPRFHQWHAVRSIVAATVEAGAGTDRLIQHSAGSGKSNTIAWTAHSLSRLHGADDAPIFDKVIVITDRVVLDRQLQETVAGLDHTPGTIVKIDQNSSQLKQALEGSAARIVITTIWKFPVIAETADAVSGRRFAIVVDEAHSSTSGDAVTQMKKVLSLNKGAVTADEEALDAAEAEEVALESTEVDAAEALVQSAEARSKHPNLSFFAFTATPKPKTLNLFGERIGSGEDATYVPFHLYSMRQAIEEGFILDVLRNYTTYSTYYKLANTEPREDPEVPVSKAKAQLARFVSLHAYNVGQKAEIIVEHFRQKSSHRVGGQAKAMVVTRSRLHAVRYKLAIDRYIADRGYDRGARPLRTLVAFSGPLTDPAAPDVVFTESGMNGFGEGQLPQQFAGEDYQLLVVADKYQTGFDQPLLHTMYVDKKLASVKAVQTLSRLNRMYPGKDETFVLDFANSAEEIKEAFEPYFESTIAAPTEPNLLYDLEHSIMSAGVVAGDEMKAAVLALLSGDALQQKVLYANLAPAVQRFTDLGEEAREAFRVALTSFTRAYVFIAQMVPWKDEDLEELFLYGRALLIELPKHPDDPMPLLSTSVQLTHLRTSITSDEAIELRGTSEPEEAIPGGGQGQQVETPMDRLSTLIANLNEVFGSELGESDKVWIEQQRLTVMADEEMRSIALDNDKQQYRIALESKVKDLIVERHESNGMLFDAFFENPQFARIMLTYLNETYEAFRQSA